MRDMLAGGGALLIVKLVTVLQPPAVVMVAVYTPGKIVPVTAVCVGLVTPLGVLFQVTV